MLDILLTNAPKCYIPKNWLPFGKSDHKVVSAVPLLYKYKLTRPEQTKVAKRSGKLIDTGASLSNVDFNEIIASCSHTNTRTSLRLEKNLHH